MKKSRRDTLAEKSLPAKWKNFALNFIIAVYWLIKSVIKYIKRLLR